MAKKGDKGSATLMGPLRIGGNMNGQASGVPGSVSPKDPFKYLSRSGMKAPAGKAGGK